MTLTIADDDGLPQIMVNDVSLTEGKTGTKNAVFTVTLSTASARTVTVAFATADNTARTVLDFARTSGTLSFAPGETSKTVSVPVVGDTTFEENETFFLTLTDASNSAIAGADGTATILNDDANPTPPTPPTPPVVVGSAPTVTFSSPQNGDILRTLDAIFGTVQDDEAVRVQVTIQRETDGKYFTGRNYSLTPTPLATTLRTTTFTRNGSSFQPLPAGSNLPPDTCFLTAVAFDAAGNRSSTTISIIVSSTRPATGT